MHTSILAFTNETDDRQAAETALAYLRDQQPIVAPTDTVYGIMCPFDSVDAIQRVYAIKRRPPEKALPILIGELAQLGLVARTPLSDVAEALATRFWPGPLTLVLPARDDLPPELIAGGDSVGVRMPDHDNLRQLIRYAGPLAATSANRSGDREAHTADEALEQLDGLIPLILSDDQSAHRLNPVASTVVDLTGPEPAILRQGPIADAVLHVLRRIDGAPCS